MGYINYNKRLGGKNPFSGRRQRSETRNPYRMYFIFTEGVQTEQKYFEELSEYSGIKDGVKIHVMNRWRAKSGNSNQYKVVQDVEKYINAISCLPNSVKTQLKGYFTQLENDCNIDTLLNISQKIKELVNSYPELLTNEERIRQQISALATLSNFDKDYDRICIFIDRDKSSCTGEQFSTLLELCEKNSYLLGVSNPCFEFFLLLHISDLNEIDDNIIYENKKENGKTFAEFRLSEELKNIGKNGFKKNNYDAKWFVENFNNGLRNSKKYCNTNKNLATNVGSSAFQIINEEFINEE